MPQRRQYTRLGLYSASTVAERFDGTWFLVCEELGYESPGGGTEYTSARLQRLNPEDMGLSPTGERKVADGGNR